MALALAGTQCKPKKTVKRLDTDTAVKQITNMNDEDNNRMKDDLQVPLSATHSSFYRIVCKRA